MTDKTSSEAVMELDALNSVPSGIGIFDVTGSTIDMKYLNDGFYQMIGARREDRAQFFSKGTINSVHPDDRAGILKEALSSIREKRIFDFQFRNLDGEGNYRWIGIRASHKALSDDTERFFASYYNVDHLVSKQHELAAYGNNLDAILGNIPGGVAVFFEQSGKIRVVYLNAGFYALHHGSREYWSQQSQNPIDWLTPEDRHLFWEEFARVASGEKAQGSVSYRIIGEDGAPHWVNNQFRRADQVDGVQYYYASFIDMDEQIAAEQEVLRDKQMYDDATMSSKLIIWSYDIYTHRAAMMQSGYTGEVCKRFGVPAVIENVAQTISAYIEPDDRAVFQSAYRSVDEGAEHAECEFRFQMPGQNSQQLEHMSLKRINDNNGRLLTVYCCGQNVTEQRQNEEHFRRTYAMIDNPDSYGSFHLNLSKNWCGNGTRGKSQIKSVLALQDSGTIDGYFNSFASLIADDDIRAAFYDIFDRKRLLSAYGSGTQRVSIEYPVVYENGTRHWREGFLDMMKNPRTGDIEAVTYSLDIDDRKKDEFIMKKLIHDHFDYIGIIHPAAKTFEFRSRRPWITYGKIGEVFPYDECCAYVRAQFSRDDERRTFDELVSLDAIIQELRANGTRLVSYLKTEGGKTSCSRLQYSWLEIAGGDILVVRADITEAYQNEQDQMMLLEEEKHAAEAASVAKSDFLSRMSHDIRTPLNGIMGMSYLAQKQQNPPKTADCLAKIDTSSKFLLGLINDVLDMSRVESSRVEFKPEPYPIDEFNAYIDAVIRPLCMEKGQTLILDNTFALRHVLPLADKLRCNQVIFNLLSNAVKYTPKGGTITYHISGRMTESGKMQIDHVISDTGIGMSEDFQKVLFEPFTQENRDDASEMRGTGLGLAIVKKLVDQMGGAIDVKSTLGVGTTFRVKLFFDTITASEYAVDPNIDRQRDKNGTSLAGRHVLLCEDHPLNQEIAKALLAEKNIVVSIAVNGKAGVDMFQNAPPHYFDAILMDIRMPVMDGINAAKAIRALSRPDALSVPIIAMTADAFAEDIKKCLDAGMNGHVSKPIDPDALFAVLNDLLK